MFCAQSKYQYFLGQVIKKKTKAKLSPRSSILSTWVQILEKDDLVAVFSRTHNQE